MTETPDVASDVLAAAALEAARRRSAFIQSLRECAAFLEQHPDVRAPHYITMNVFVDTREEVAAHARVATWKKEFNGQWFSLQRSFGEDLSLDITAPRETVCRKVVVGTEVVPEHTQEIVEWVCDEPAVLK